MTSKKNARPGWNPERANKRSAHLLYQKKHSLSSEVRECIVGFAAAVIFTVDLAAFPCFVGLMHGVQMSGGKLSLALFFCAQMAVTALVAACMAIRMARKAKTPKRLGMITDWQIRKALEAYRK